MSITEEVEEIHNCSLCDKNSSEVECFIKAKENLLICNECVLLCESLIAERKSDDVDFSLIRGERSKIIKEKLRPITRMPKSWIVCDSDLLSRTPSVTACAPDKKKLEKFSIPKQLAFWMLAIDEKMDLDQIREEIEQNLRRKIMEMVKSY